MIIPNIWEKKKCSKLPTRFEMFLDDASDNNVIVPNHNAPLKDVLQKSGDLEKHTEHPYSCLPLLNPLIENSGLSIGKMLIHASQLDNILFIKDYQKSWGMVKVQLSFFL